MMKHHEKFEEKEVDMIRSFTTMVKSGEAYFTKDDVSGLMPETPDRPRNIFVPPPDNCSYPVYVQSFMWGPLRKSFEGFVQGYDKSQYLEWMKSRVDESWSSLSIDGSAFDSTQFAVLMDCVENQLFARIHSSRKCERAFYECLNNSKELVWTDRAKRNLWNSVWKSAKKNKVVAFTYLPNYCSANKRWSDALLAEWQRSGIKCQGEDWSRPWRYYLATPLNGTTFSGHSTKTTLGNTLRSLFYMYYYIYKSGLPWNWETFERDYPV